MRKLQLAGISALSPNVYAATFRSPHTICVVECRLRDDEGLTRMEATPDLFVTGELSQRSLSAAIIGFHNAQRAQEMWAEKLLPA